MLGQGIKEGNGDGEVINIVQEFETCNWITEFQVDYYRQGKI